MNPAFYQKVGRAPTVGITKKTPKTIVFGVTSCAHTQLREFSKADFQTPTGASSASYGTITVSNAKPDTRLILEDKAPGREKSKQASKAEKELAGKTGAGGEVKIKRFKNTFTITQA